MFVYFTDADNYVAACSQNLAQVQVLMNEFEG